MLFKFPNKTSVVKQSPIITTFSGFDKSKLNSFLANNFNLSKLKGLKPLSPVFMYFVS